MIKLRSAERSADWKGRSRKRWRWKTLRFEWGRYCYVTDCTGDTVASWFEWESDRKVNQHEPIDSKE